VQIWQRRAKAVDVTVPAWSTYIGRDQRRSQLGTSTVGAAAEVPAATQPATPFHAAPRRSCARASTARALPSPIAYNRDGSTIF
jgi:hypothetical protein